LPQASRAPLEGRCSPCTTCRPACRPGRSADARCGPARRSRLQAAAPERSSGTRTSPGTRRLAPARGGQPGPGPSLFRTWLLALSCRLLLQSRVTSSPVREAGTTPPRVRPVRRGKTAANAAAVAVGAGLSPAAVLTWGGSRRSVKQVDFAEEAW